MVVKAAQIEIESKSKVDRILPTKEDPEWETWTGQVGNTNMHFIRTFQKCEIIMRTPAISRVQKSLLFNSFVHCGGRKKSPRTYSQYCYQ
jgi:hypothetical protein